MYLRWMSEFGFFSSGHIHRSIIVLILQHFILFYNIDTAFSL